MHYINIHNKAGHPQEFQVHGFNNNQNVTVPPRGKHAIPAPDHASGAVIAVHDGQIGEQCEITKCGWQGNDVVDISNICGAGGNMTVQQVGDAPNKFKGHPLFMQKCNEAWHKANQQTKNAMKSHVFLDNKGNVKRIGAPKDNQALEKFVRTFAQGKTYIGVGAWNGNKGDPGDNAQSSAGHGSKDILITYSDGDASPQAREQFAHRAIAALCPPDVEMDFVPEGIAATKTGGPGIRLENKSKKEHTYFFYDNYWNGNGTAGANFDHPLKSVKLGAGASTHVPLPLSFKGRVQRGTQLPATWAEFQVQASNDGASHGDISLEQGYDGAAEIASTDGTNVKGGFVMDLMEGAPAAAIKAKPNGEKALASTEGNWTGPGNKAASDWMYKKLGHGKAYILGGTGVPDIASHNQCLAVTFY